MQVNYQSLYESAPGLHLVLLPDLTIVAVSDTYLLYTKNTREDIIGRSILAVFPGIPADDNGIGESALETSLAYVVQTGKPHTMAIHPYLLSLPEAGSEKKYWRIKHFPVFSDDHRLNYIIHQIEDVTSQKTAEERMQFLATIARNIQDPVIAADNNFIITDWNEAAEELLEWSSVEAIGKSTLDILQITYPYTSRDKIIEFFYEKGFWKGEVIYHTKSGKALHVLVTASSLIDGNGNIAGSLVLAKDITERSRATEALISLNTELEDKINQRTAEVYTNEKRFRALVEYNDAIISLVDEELNVFFRSASAERITGWTNDEFKKINVKTYVHPDELQAIQMAMAIAAANAGVNIPVEIRVLHKKGHYIWLKGMITNLLHDPAIKGIVTNLMDVTDMKLAEQKIMKINRLLLFISQINRMILRANNENTLYKEACQIAVGFGKFRMVWMGMLDKESNKIIPFIHAGDARDFMQAVKNISAEELANKGGAWPAAIKQGKCFVRNDTEYEPQTTPSIKTDMDIGYQSYMLLPILKFGEVTGVFGYYAAEKYFFDDEEITLLKEASHEISFALENFEKEKLRVTAENTLRQNRIFIESIINASPDIIYIYDLEESKNVFVNEGIQSNLGYTSAEIKQMDNQLIQILMHPDDIISYHANTYPKYFTAADKDIIVQEYRMKNKNGNWHWFYSKESVFVRNPDGTPKQILGISSNISDQKKNEEKIKNATLQLRQLSAHLLDIREEERKRIGREIHDELGQQLTAIKMDIVWIDKNMNDESKLIKNKLKNINKLLDGSNESVRKILSELRPAILNQQALPEALIWQGHQFTKTTGVSVEFCGHDISVNLSKEITTCLFRVYQESLTNITRYAKASSVSTSLTTTADAILLEVTDNGIGFDTGLMGDKKTFGIVGMRERVLSLDGKFELVSSPGIGTTLKISIPISQN